MSTSAIGSCTRTATVRCSVSSRSCMSVMVVLLSSSAPGSSMVSTDPSPAATAESGRA